VLDHHQRVYQAIGEALPRVRNPRVREEVTKLRQHLGKEIEQLKADSQP
jgi:chaperonin cofactor prefoldin